MIGDEPARFVDVASRRVEDLGRRRVVPTHPVEYVGDRRTLLPGDLVEARLVAGEVGGAGPPKFFERGFDPFPDEQEALVPLGAQGEVPGRRGQAFVAQPGEELPHGRFRWRPCGRDLRSQVGPTGKRLGLTEVGRQPAPDREGEVDEGLRERAAKPSAAGLEEARDRVEDPDDRAHAVLHRSVVPDEVGGQGDRAHVRHRILVELAALAEVKERALEKEAEEEAIDATPVREGVGRLLREARKEGVGAARPGVRRSGA